MIIHCGLICIPLMIGDAEHLCMSVGHVFFGKMFRFSDHFLFRLFAFFYWVPYIFCCLSSLHILNINCLWDIWFANIFSHTAGCFFYFWRCPLLESSFLVWSSSTDLFLLFLPLLLKSESQIQSQDQCQGSYSLCSILGLFWNQILCSSI